MSALIEREPPRPDINPDNSIDLSDTEQRDKLYGVTRSIISYAATKNMQAERIQRLMLDNPEQHAPFIYSQLNGLSTTYPRLGDAARNIRQLFPQSFKE